MGGELATERIGRVNARVRSSLPKAKSTGSELSVSVALISHNYGRYIRDCWLSVANQTRKVDEIVVIDDSSTDETRSVARSLGLRCFRIDKGHQYHSMEKALKETTGDLVCFLDADDFIPKNYIEEGLKRFDSYDVGIVYSDMEQFGAGSKTVPFPEFDRDSLERDNFMHAGSLVRREALVSSMCLEVGIPEGMRCATDWYVWKHLCRQGWKGARQTSRYKYRIHKKSNSYKKNVPYFTLACLAAEPVTFFLALSGRTRYWKRTAAFLDKQTWPKDQVRIVLADTSGSKKFHKTLKKWVYRSDYDDIRLFKFDVGETSGQADRDRRDDSIRHSVQRSVARIYNKMAREIATEYVFTLEDDVLPPADVIYTLMQGFDPSTASVAAPLRSRYHNGYLHWKWPKEICVDPGSGIEEIAGSGFGCTIIRGSVLKDTVFTSNPKFCNGDFDGSFYQRLSPWKAKVHWNCPCIHGEQAGGSS